MDDGMHHGGDGLGGSLESGVWDPLLVDVDIGGHAQAHGRVVLSKYRKCLVIA